MADRAETKTPSAEESPDAPVDDLEQALLDALDEHEAANEALRDYLALHRKTARATIERLLGGEHPWQVLMDEDAAGRRGGYLEVWRRFENSRRDMRRLVILWAKRKHGMSYRSMADRLGISEQMAIKLGGQAAKVYPPGGKPKGRTHSFQ